MQPTKAHRRPCHVLKRLTLAALLALAVTAAPSATVQACSCAWRGGPVDVARQAIAESDVAFIGTVIDTAPAPPDRNGFGPMVRYAFAVDAASATVEEIVEVRALDDGGGASCGFTFGREETWFVTANAQDGILHTGLCSGNAMLKTLEDADREGLTALLNVEPLPSTDPPTPGTDWLPIAGIGLALLAVGAITVLAFGRGTPDRPADLS